MDAKGTIAAALQGGITSVTPSEPPGTIALGKARSTSVTTPADIFLTSLGHVSCNHTGTMSEPAMRAEIEKILSSPHTS
jgi:hypothetical protein